MFLPSICDIAYNNSKIKNITDNWYILRERTTISKYLRVTKGDNASISSSTSKQDASYVWIMNLDLSYANMQKNSDGVWEIIQD